MKPRPPIGKSHGISFEMKGVPAGGYSVLYGVELEDGGGVDVVASWSAASPQFTHVGTRTVRYAVSAEGYDALTNSATVTITPRSLNDAAIGSLSFTTVDGVRTPVATLVDDLGNVLGAEDADFTWEIEESGVM